MLSVLSKLAQASQGAAKHDCMGHRYWMARAIISGIAAQNDADGILIAASSAEDVVATGIPTYLQDVPFSRDECGSIVDIPLHEARFANQQEVEIAREIAMSSDPDLRLIALEAACLALIQDDNANLGKFSSELEEIRRTGGGFEDFDYPVAAEAEEEEA